MKNLLLTLCMFFLLGCGGSNVVTDFTSQPIVIGPTQTHNQTPIGAICGPNPSDQPDGIAGHWSRCVVSRPPGTHWCQPAPAIRVVLPSGFVVFRPDPLPLLRNGETAIITTMANFSGVQGQDFVRRSNCLVVEPGTTLDMYWLQTNGLHSNWGNGPYESEPVGQNYPLVGIRQVVEGPISAHCIGPHNVNEPNGIFECVGNSSTARIQRWEVPASGNAPITWPWVGSISSSLYP